MTDENTLKGGWKVSDARAQLLSADVHGLLCVTQQQSRRTAVDYHRCHWYCTVYSGTNNQ